jgi:hypothetical protein
MPDFLDLAVFNPDGRIIARVVSRGISAPPESMLWKDLTTGHQIDKNAKGPVYYGVKFVERNGNEEKMNLFTLKKEADVNYFGKYIAIPTGKDVSGLVFGLFTWDIGMPEPDDKKAVKALEKIAKNIKLKNKDKWDRELMVGCRPPYDTEMELAYMKFD